MNCIGEYSEEVDMWRIGTERVQASQYSAADWRILWIGRDVKEEG
jgi:hypothetical protein